MAARDLKSLLLNFAFLLVSLSDSLSLSLSVSRCFSLVVLCAPPRAVREITRMAAWVPRSYTTSLSVCLTTCLYTNVVNRQTSMQHLLSLGCKPFVIAWLLGEPQPRTQFIITAWKAYLSAPALRYAGRSLSSILRAFRFALRRKVSSIRR